MAAGWREEAVRVTLQRALVGGVHEHQPLRPEGPEPFPERPGEAVDQVMAPCAKGRFRCATLKCTVELLYVAVTVPLIAALASR